MTKPHSPYIVHSVIDDDYNFQSHYFQNANFQSLKSAVLSAVKDSTSFSVEYSGGCICDELDELKRIYPERKDKYKVRWQWWLMRIQAIENGELYA